MLKRQLAHAERDLVHGDTGDPYAVLGVPRQATADELRAAYERRVEASAKAGDLVGAQRVNAAYELLRHDTRRAMFDRTGLVSEPVRPAPDVRFVAVKAVPFRAWSSSATPQRRRTRGAERAWSWLIVVVVVAAVVGGWRSGVLTSSGSVLRSDVWSMQPATVGAPPSHLVVHPHRLLPATAPPAGTGGFLASGVRYDPCQPIHYVVSGAPPFDGATTLLDQAIAVTSRATGLQFQYDGDSDETPTEHRAPYQPRRYGNHWAPVLVAWTNDRVVPRLAGGVVGLGGSVAVDRSGERRLVSGIVYLDAPDLTSIMQRPDGVFDVQTVVLHELGHLVGLGHVADPTSVMFPQSLPHGFSYSDGDRRGLAYAGSGSCSHFS